MAGMPQRRARRPPAVSIRPPAEWRALTPGAKMEYLLGCSLDDAYVIAHWDPNEADVHQLAAKIRLIEIMTKHGFRFAIEAIRDQGRDRAIEQLASALTQRHTHMRGLAGPDEAEPGHKRDTEELSC